MIITSEEDAKAKFKAILGTKEAWAPFADSQLVENLGLFMSWGLRAAQFDTIRAMAETHRSTALNRSSIIAKAEDVGYIPRKTTPSAGSIDITNNGAATISIPLDTPLLSDDGIGYIVTEPLVAGSGATVTGKISQVEKQDIISIVSAAKSFHTVLLGTDVSEKLSSFKVYVDETMSGTYEEWEYAAGFRNTGSDEKVYDEFYSHTDESGIRFGNGVFGKIVPAGANVKVTVFLSQGETFLLASQALSVVGELNDSAGNPANLEIITKENITGGAARETTEEIKTGVGYWPVYNNKLVWGEDYIFFLKQNFSGVLWGKAWGEQEQETEAGSASVDYINKIWITGYCPSRPVFATEAIAALEAYGKQLNRIFVWVAPSHVTFNVTIEGKVAAGKNISEITQTLTTIFESHYGKDSATRKDSVLINDMYAAANETGFFDVPAAAYVVITVSGTTTPAHLKDMVSLGTLTINISYL